MSMRILIANIGKIFTEYRKSHWRRKRSIKKGVFKTFANLQEKNLCCCLFLIKFIKKIPAQLFLGEI